MGSGGGHGLQLDRTEAVRKMHRYKGDQQTNGHRYPAKRDESPEQHRRAAKQFDQNRCPCQQVWRGSAEGVQDLDEGIGPARKLRVTMLHETISDDQAQRDGHPASRIPAARLLRSWETAPP